MSKLSSFNPYYLLPTITRYSKNSGTENTVFSIYITYTQPVPETQILKRVLSVSFGSYRIAEPTVLPDNYSEPNSFSVTVKAPHFSVAAQGLLQDSRVPVSLIVAPPDNTKAPQQLYVCEFSYETASSPATLTQAPPLQSHGQVSIAQGPSDKSLSVIQSTPVHLSPAPNTSAVASVIDPRVVSPENVISGSLVVNSQTDPNLAGYYNQQSIQLQPGQQQQPVQQGVAPSRIQYFGSSSASPIAHQQSGIRHQNLQLIATNPQGIETASPQQQALSVPSTGSNQSQLQYTHTTPKVQVTGSSNSMSPLDTNYTQVSYHHQPQSSTPSTSYLDPSYPRVSTTGAQQGTQQHPVTQQQTHVYYPQGSSYYQQPQGYDINVPYDTSSSSVVADLSGWNISGVPTAGSMGSQGSYYQPRVLGSPSQMGITDSRTFMASQIPHPQMGMPPMMYGQFDTSMAIPQLVRTTALSQATMSLGLGGMGHDPLVNESTKASLEIVGNLDHMTGGWTEQETEAKRRLVQFKRTQRGPVVSVEFFPLEASKYTQNTPCISCIQWEEKKECFVTSVDCIYLLEQLINNKFTVEEKNRIRRNLEGYHPLTVSKGKASSGEFFKLIMSFSSPKPRNIEKDVKVFQWSLLGKALQKIIGKYSADYGGHAASLGYGSGGSYHTAHQIIPLQHTLLTPQQQQQVRLQAQPQMTQHPHGSSVLGVSGSLPAPQYSQEQDSSQQQDYARVSQVTVPQWQRPTADTSGAGGSQQYPPPGGYR